MGRQDAGYGQGLEVATLLQDRLQVGDSLHQLVCPSSCPHLDVHPGSLTLVVAISIVGKTPLPVPSHTPRRGRNIGNVDEESILPKG